MKNNRRINYLRNILMPCLLLSSVAGIFTGALIFLFKLAANFVIHLSTDIYDAARRSPQYILPILIAAAGLGVVVYFVLRIAPEIKGGGIPTAVTALRGFISFDWIKSVFLLFPSALITFFVGVPLGNEGPSVQMGSAVGKGTVNIFAHKNKAWERYIMTGGACGGFAAATGAPLSGMLFAFEEVHRRFSPIIFMTVSTAVLASSATMEILCDIFGKQSGLFHFDIQPIMPVKFVWIALIIGVVCGLVAIAFTKGYMLVDKVVNEAMARVPLFVKIVAVFLISASFGILSAGLIGSGHSLIDELFDVNRSPWYFLMVYILVRGVMLLVANNVGITGGTFVPTLAFGALVGALCANVAITAGVIDAEYNAFLISLGMVAFLGATSRIPLTAIAFSLEVLSGMRNILHIVAAISISFLIIELAGMISFTDAVIAHKIKARTKGKMSQMIDLHMTVQKDAFAVGKEIRDILWPPNCVVLSVKKAESVGTGIHADDILHLRCLTYDKAETLILLESLIGAQSESDLTSTHENEKNYSVPEI